MGKYEVTAGQYTEFLNAKASTSDAYGLYSTSMADTWGCQIQKTWTPVSKSYTYSVASDYANRPVTCVSFWDAARFTNWLQSGDTESGAYHNVGNQALFGRNPGAKFFVPTEEERYKSAYHDKSAGLLGSYFDYPTGTNWVPGVDLTELTKAGDNANYETSDYPWPLDPPYHTTLPGEFQLSNSSYGTYDQGGNVWEWNETILYGSYRGLRGGAFNTWGSDYLLASHRYDYYPPEHETNGIGFRVGSVTPEPSAFALLAIGAIGLLAYAWRRRKRTM